MYLASFDSNSMASPESIGGLKIKYKIDTPTSMAMTEREYEVTGRMSAPGFSEEDRRDEVD